MTKVGIIMGSDSDLKVMSEAANILDQFNIEYELTIVSAHRTPERLYQYAQSAKDRGLKIIIAGAGGAAHLPGMVAAISPLPVIGVPIKTKALKGVDSLHSIVQMPAGIPVATVAINGGTNAGLLAVQILGAFDKGISEQINSYRENLNNSVLEKAKNLEEIGYKKYIKEFM
ncbi:5-(carboxyamino)imidazole ribonucleotide mutase [uncultured Tyzzerella sp.]|uniref:5-(carboxyamino)imidazole ribonucleotide mutase n=1 Tax=uncultured Tyzzerella sp. TaxID=2321398 RepID=UPI002943ECEA|nr:5-(carboxyamino)imidazole ribonucleotide mutase [uncultured Tyzzerella sp.]